MHVPRAPGIEGVEEMLLVPRDIEGTILPFAREHGIGALAYGPTAHGSLSGRMTEDTTFAALAR